MVKVNYVNSVYCKIAVCILKHRVHIIKICVCVM